MLRLVNRASYSTTLFRLTRVPTSGEDRMGRADAFRLPAEEWQRVGSFLVACSKRGTLPFIYEQTRGTKLE